MQYAVDVPPAPTPVPAPVAIRPGILLLRIVGLLLVLALIAGGALQVISVFFRQSSRETLTFSGPIRQVQVGINIGDIRLHPSAGNGTATLVRSVTWSFTKPTSTATLAGGVLSVSGRCPGAPIVGSFCQVGLDLSVPAGVSVVLRSSTGDISVTGLTGSVRASTSTGEVSLRQLQSAEVTARSSTGDITIALLAPAQAVQARSSTGDVTVLVPNDGTAYRVSTATSVGHRTIRVPTDPGSSRTINATTSTGDITIQTS